jgi:hypothetical protein
MYRLLHGHSGLRRGGDDDAISPQAIGEREDFPWCRAAAPKRIVCSELLGQLDAIRPDIHGDRDAALDSDQLSDELAHQAEPDDDYAVADSDLRDAY